METTEKTEGRIFTVPNILSFIRILLIPLIVISYFVLGNNYLAVGLIAVSGLTDIADGFIARKFDTVSNVGKILDPIADKLTQMAVLTCLAFKNKRLIVLITIFVLKELVMGISGLITIKKNGIINSAKWYGKANTVLLYFAMIVLILFSDIGDTAINIITGVCLLSLIFSLVMYIVFYAKIWKKYRK